MTLSCKRETERLLRFEFFTLQKQNDLTSVNAELVTEKLLTNGKAGRLIIFDEPTTGDGEIENSYNGEAVRNCVLTALNLVLALLFVIVDNVGV